MAESEEDDEHDDAQMSDGGLYDALLFNGNVVSYTFNAEAMVNDWSLCSWSRPDYR